MSTPTTDADLIPRVADLEKWAARESPEYSVPGRFAARTAVSPLVAPPTPDRVSRVAELEAWRARLIARFPARTPGVPGTSAYGVALAGDMDAAYFDLCDQFHARGLEIDALKAARTAAEEASKNPVDQHPLTQPAPDAPTPDRTLQSDYFRKCREYDAKCRKVEDLEAQLAAELARRSPIEQKLDRIIALVSPSTLPSVWR